MERGTERYGGKEKAVIGLALCLEWLFPFSIAETTAIHTQPNNVQQPALLLSTFSVKRLWDEGDSQHRLWAFENV